MNKIKPEGISTFRTNKKIRTEVKVKVDFWFEWNQNVQFKNNKKKFKNPYNIFV
jgi:hypothetical protein